MTNITTALRAACASGAMAIALALPGAALAQDAPQNPAVRPIMIRQLPPPRVAAPAATNINAVRVPITTRIETPPMPVIPGAPALRVEKGKAVKARPVPVTLRGGTGGLTVLRQLPAASLRSRTPIAVGRGKLNLAPLLDNPRALPSIAQQLRAMPQLADVVSDEIEGFEVPQGIVLRTTMAYRLKPGTCADAGRKALLARSGLSCAAPMNDQTRAAAYANPRDPHYVEDPGRRASAIAEAQQRAVQTRADVDSQVTQFRSMLNDPAQRATLEAQLGAEEVVRLQRLGNDALAEEAANLAETRVEQVMFVPNLDQLDVVANAKPQKAGGTPSVLYGGMMMKPAGGYNPNVLAATAAAMDKVEKVLPIEPHIFLTGFTLGREYEWRQRVETTVSWCFVGCKKTYYAEVYAGFNYGFGLRFPIEAKASYKYNRVGQAETATITPEFLAVNGTTDQYRESGLPDYQLFDGKELVAQFGAYAGAAYKVPVLGSGGISFDVGMDFTKDLPAPFTNGQFIPPTPGVGGGPRMTKVFEDFDLIGGRANFGVAGAKVFPAVQVDLVSNDLHFTLHDEIANADRIISAGGSPVKVEVDPKDHSSRFTMGDPSYNLAFNVTPGLNARLFIDVAVWSHNWDWPVWFPQLAIQLPPGGVDFGCHEGTQCSRSYRITPGGISESSNAVGVYGEIDKWGFDFDNQHLTECADDTCKMGVKFVRLGTVLGAKQEAAAWDAAHASEIEAALKAGQKKPEIAWSAFDDNFARAKSDITPIINEAQARLTKKASLGMGELVRAVWTKRCSDKPCYDKVTTISKLHELEMNAQQKLHPDFSTLQISGEVGRKFSPIYQAEIDASKARVAAAEAVAAANAAKWKGPAVQPVGLRPLPRQ